MAASGLVPTPEQIEAQFIARPLSITAAEFRKMLRQAGLSTIANDRAQATAYYNHVFGTIAPEILETNKILTDTLLAALQGPADPVAIAAARDLGARQTKRIWGDLARTELNKIGEVIKTGVADGRGPREVARRLQSVTALDPQRAGRLGKMEDYLRSRGLSEEAVEQQTARFKRKLIRERREGIARTEMRLATEAGNQNAAKSGDKNWKVWITAGDSAVDEDDCQPNEAQGWIPIKDAFSSGHDTPPAHPNCRCTASYRARPPSKAGEERAKRRSDKTAAAKKADKDEKAKKKENDKATKAATKKFKEQEKAKAKPKPKAKPKAKPKEEKQKAFETAQASPPPKKPTERQNLADLKAEQNSSKATLTSLEKQLRNKQRQHNILGVTAKTPKATLSQSKKELAALKREVKDAKTQIRVVDEKLKRDDLLAKIAEPLKQADKDIIKDYTADAFFQVNQSLNAGHPGQVAAFTDKLDVALSKLPAAPGETIRQIRFFDDADLNAFLKQHQRGAPVKYPGYTSTTKLTEAEFGGTIGEREVLMKINGKSGRDITRFALNPDEREVLYSRNTQFIVESIETRESGATVITLTEV